MEENADACKDKEKDSNRFEGLQIQEGAGIRFEDHRLQFSKGHINIMNSYIALSLLPLQNSIYAKTI